MQKIHSNALQMAIYRRLHKTITTYLVFVYAITGHLFNSRFKTFLFLLSIVRPLLLPHFPTSALEIVNPPQTTFGNVITNMLLPNPKSIAATLLEKNSLVETKFEFAPSKKIFISLCGLKQTHELSIFQNAFSIRSSCYKSEWL